MSRDRQQGWVHAKGSGHANELEVRDKINSDRDFADSLSQRLSLRAGDISCTGEGASEERVASVLGEDETTKSKTDLILNADGERRNISLKRSESGQVYLVTKERFIAGFESQFKRKIGDDVRECLGLFIGGNDEAILGWVAAQQTADIPADIKEHERKRKRLTLDSIAAIDANKPRVLLDWFKENLREVFVLCFQRGLAREQEDWARYLWYLDTVERKVEDQIFDLEGVAGEIGQLTDAVEVGTRGGGTTIQFPFGFLQWHQAQMQFHHRQDRMAEHFGKHQL